MVITYKCPNCGGGLQFDPATQKYKCEFCFSLFTQEELEQLYREEEQESDKESRKHQAESENISEKSEHGSEKPEYGSEKPENQDEGTVLYQCPSCGAQIVTDETTAATFCYYCHNPVVLSGRVSGEFRPDEVIPFAIDRKQAEKMFVDWIQKKHFVPADFFSKKQIEKLSGIYFPYWVFGCKVNGQLKAEGVKIHTWRSGDMQYTETKRYDVARSGIMDIRNVARNALQKADRDLIEGVLPYDMEKAQPFSGGYLTGFAAEKRDMEQADFRETLRAEIEEYARSDMRSQAESGYHRIQVQAQNMEIQEESWKYMLFPVWLLTYQDKKRDKVYYFALNGQTGRICGALPVDFKKLSMLFAGIFVPLLILFLAVGYLI